MFAYWLVYVLAIVKYIWQYSESPMNHLTCNVVTLICVPYTFYTYIPSVHVCAFTCTNYTYVRSYTLCSFTNTNTVQPIAFITITSSFPRHLAIILIFREEKRVRELRVWHVWGRAKLYTNRKQVYLQRWAHAMQCYWLHANVHMNCLATS